MCVGICWSSNGLVFNCCKGTETQLSFCRILRGFEYSVNTFATICLSRGGHSLWQCTLLLFAGNAMSSV